MNEEERKRAKQIMDASVRGRYISAEDHAFLRKCWSQHSKEYSELHAEVKRAACAEVNPLYDRGSRT